MSETLDKFRQTHPEYQGVDDATLADGIYRKFYADKMDRSAFDAKIGFDPGGVSPTNLPQEVDAASYVADVARGVGKQNDANDEWRGRAASALQGATFGFADEAVAGLRSLTGDDYDTALAEERNVLEGAQEREPLTSLGLEVAGGLAVPGFGTAKALQSATKLGKYGRLALGGAFGGGLYGAGASEGGLDERLTGAAFGAATGGVAAPALVGAINVLGKPARMLGDMAGLGGAKRAETVANRKILQKIYESGLTLDDVAARLDEASRLGVKGGSLADVPIKIGDEVFEAAPLQRLLSAAGRIPGGSAQTVTNFARARKAGERGRIADYFSDMLGTDKNADDFLQEMIQRQTDEAKPLYAVVDSLDVPTDKVKGLFERNLFKKAWRSAQELADAEGVVLPNLADDALPDTLPASVLDNVKKGLDALIEGQTDAVTGKMTSLGRAIVKAKEEFVTVMDDIVPDGAYAKARNAFAGPASMMDAMRQGEKIFSSKVTPGSVGRTLAKMTDSEKEAFRVGVMQAVRDKMSSDRGDKVSKVFGSDDMRAVLREVFEPEDFKRLSDILGRETVMARTGGEIMGNSKTAQRGLDDADFLDDPARVLEDSTSLPRLVARKLAGYWDNYNKRTAGNVADKMTETNPSRLQQLLDVLRSFEEQQLKRANSPFRSPITYGVGGTAPLAGQFGAGEF